ncbi:MAG TPA: AAA family ATPase [Candidatus Saccharimonadales bacterium]
MKSLSLTKPHLIVVVGVPGSGKTFFAQKFADTFSAPYINTEKITELSAGDSAATKNLLNYCLDELLKTRQSIIIEGTGDTRTERADLARKARAAGYETLITWVQTDPTTAKSRSTRRSSSKTNRIYSPEEYDRLAKRFTAPNTGEKPLVISGKHTYATQAKVVLKRLSAPRAEISVHTTPIASERERPGRRSITIR